MAAAETKVFKKVEVVEGGGHHGGGWKVAYADFMTAMMAFFLLMWILASSDEQKLRGIAEYFTNATMPGGSGVLDGATLGPAGTLTASNGAVVARGSDLGKNDHKSTAKWEVRDATPSEDEQAKIIASSEDAQESPVPEANPALQSAGLDGSTGMDTGADSAAEAAQAQAMAEARAADDAQFEQLQEDILQAMQQNPELETLHENVIFEKTPEGLNILIVDQDGKPMFHSGRAEMAGATQTLLRNLGQSLASLPNRMILAGHTDAVPFADSSRYDNWDLSADRANATRRVFEGAGVDRERIIRVSGLADTQPLVPEDPKDASNRRISIMVQYRDTAMAQNSQSAKPVKEAKATPQQGQKPEQHAASAATAEPSPLGDQVFDHLRSALR